MREGTSASGGRRGSGQRRPGLRSPRGPGTRSSRLRKLRARQHGQQDRDAQFWNAYNETDTEASTMAKVVIPQFEKQNPGIKVDSVVYPTPSCCRSSSPPSAAGDPPDVLRSDIAWVPELASQGVAAERQPACRGSRPITKRRSAGPACRRPQYKGATTRCRCDTNTQALFWNKADFAAAGLSGPPTTHHPAVRRREPSSPNKAKEPVRPGRRRHRHLECRSLCLEPGRRPHERGLHAAAGVHERPRHRRQQCSSW